MIADVDLELLFSNRVDGTTIPLYDKRAELYASKVEIIRTVPAGKQKVGTV